MWAFIEGAWKFIESAGNLIERVGTITEGARQDRSYVSIDDNVETLKRKCEDLRFRAEDVKTELGNAESSSGQKRRKTVDNWLTNVQNLRNRVDAALSQTGILERPQLASEVKNLTEQVEEFLEKGKFPQGLTLYTPHNGGVELLTKPLVGQAFQENLEKIWRYLMEPELLTIGIWGMGGVGKTTLVTHINNRARKQRDTFSDVCWVTISQNLDIHKLQQKLANAVCLKFDDEDEMERASMLYSELEKRRCLLILDDVWQDIDFHKVGIPVKVNCGKVIITFHIDRHVLRDMAINMKSIEFMVKSGIQLEELPGKHEWSEHVKIISLMTNKIKEVAVPSSTAPRCPKLSTLLLSGNRSLNRIESSFFQHMPALQILDLTDCMSIEELPDSVSNLKNLIALVLHGCCQLRKLPSLAELELMKRLDLCNTGITKVPHGFERLVRLTYLDLYGTPITEVPHGLESMVRLTYLDLRARHLQVFPTGILPQLLLLEFLTFNADVEIKGEELRRLERLSTFEGRVIFDDVNGFKSYVMSGRTHRGPNCSYVLN